MQYDSPQLRYSLIRHDLIRHNAGQERYDAKECAIQNGGSSSSMIILDLPGHASNSH